MKRIDTENDKLDNELQKLIDIYGLEEILNRAEIEPVQVLCLLVELEWILEDDLPKENNPPIDFSTD